ncbi:uncharacterized protein [Drosophila bipectinata]|uniref:uncharacterized protein n=1 Tax=Drosophila bipectinata TaxID=42026 RepID=UPI0038B23857
MFQMLRLKCRSLVNRSMLPCIESLMNACAQFKGDWAKNTGLLRQGQFPSILQPIQMRRYSSGKKGSEPPECPEPRQCESEKKSANSCGPARFKGTICQQGQGKKKKEPKEKPKKKLITPDQLKMQSMWYVPGCEYEKKCYVPARLDIKHYRVSNKEEREYQVTWNECPRLLIKPRKVCIYQRSSKPKRCRRKRKVPAATARPSLPMLNPMECKKAEKLECPRWVLPCCKPVRNPPSCKLNRTISKCKKIKAPYPSFSECKKEALNESPPVECQCLRIPMACEMWAELRRRIARGKDPTIKCGEV